MIKKLWKVINLKELYTIAKQSRMRGALRWSFLFPVHTTMSDVSALFGILSTFNDVRFNDVSL